MSPSEVGALLSGGRRTEALAAASEGVRAHPGDAAWLHALGAAQFRNDMTAQALETLQQAAALSPDDPMIRNTLGAMLIEMQRYAESEAVLRGAAVSGVMVPEALFNLAIALRGQGKHEELVDTLERIPATWVHADRVASELAKAGLYLLLSGRAKGAVRALRAQLKLQPGAGPAYHNLALALVALDRHGEAVAAISGALAAGHRDAELWAILVSAKAMTCDWEGFDAAVEELRRAAREPGSGPAHPQIGQYLARVSAEEQRQWAESYSRATFAGLEPLERRPIAPARKLRIGYLSSDFRDHAVAWLVVGLIEHHDRERFEVRAYATGPRVATPVRERIARAVDEFVDASTVPGRTVAERIAADGIDVLIDLGGHTKGARLDILAYRPAPVQGHFLGYAGTTGASFVDFFVADEVTVPTGAQSSFSERVLRLPRCFMPGDPQRPLPGAASRSEHGLRDDAVVLCSFNQPAKIQREVFEQWCALLEALPNAQLMLRDPGDDARSRLAAFAAQRKVQDRIVFAPHLATREAHMARLALADIALDTFPYGSHTNAADALWAGVPLVTTRGATFASRVGASLLATAGLSEWAFDDPGKAFDATVAMARDPAALAAAREKARGARTSALFDAAGFARDFERLLLEAAGRA